MTSGRQVVIVTGAARGIGRAISLRLARQHTQMVLADVDEGPLQRMVASLRRRHVQVVGVVGDVADPEADDRFVSAALRFRGRIDALIHAAGIAKFSPFLKTSADLWNETLRVNLTGSFMCGQRVAREMARTGGGRIVFVASTNAYQGESQLTAYNASKGGVILLAKTMARELGVYRITVNAIAPGFIRTRLNASVWKSEGLRRAYEKSIPLGRLGWPDDVAGAAVFFLSPEAGYISGATLLVDGGQLA